MSAVWSTSSLSDTEFLIIATRCAKRHVEIDSSVCARPGCIVATITVRQLPPKDAFKRRVSGQSRKAAAATAAEEEAEVDTEDEDEEHPQLLDPYWWRQARALNLITVSQSSERETRSERLNGAPLDTPPKT